jgi:hypothetical protein
MIELNRHLINPTPTLPLPLKGREAVILLPPKDREVVMPLPPLKEGSCYFPPPSRGREGGGWGLSEQYHYHYVFSMMDSSVRGP